MIGLILFQQKEESSHPVSSGPSSAAPRATPAAAPVSSGGGGGDMMSEMQKRLQARKAKTENPAPVAVRTPFESRYTLCPEKRNPYRYR